MLAPEGGASHRGVERVGEPLGVRVEIPYPVVDALAPLLARVPSEALVEAVADAHDRDVQPCLEEAHDLVEIGAAGKLPVVFQMNDVGRGHRAVEAIDRAHLAAL